MEMVKPKAKTVTMKLKIRKGKYELLSFLFEHIHLSFCVPLLK